MANIYNERTPENSTSGLRMGCSLREGKSTIRYTVDLADGESLQEILQDFLGYTGDPAPGGFEGLTRFMPAQHPIMPTWFAKSVSNIDGVGKGVRKTPNLKDPASSEGGGLNLDYTLFPTYYVDIDYGPLDYDVLADSKISNIQASAYRRETQQSYKYAAEWLRFTVIQQAPMNNIVTLNKGQAIFYDNKLIAGAFSASKDAPFPSDLRMYIGDAKLKITWYNVPFRYYTSVNSYLRRFVGTINQHPWYNWDAGQLLYLGCLPVVHKQPQIDTLALVTEDPAGAAGFAPALPSVQERFADIELDFLLANRYTRWIDYSALFGTMAGSGGLLVEHSWTCPFGHNLLPSHIDREFHYAKCPLGIKTADGTVIAITGQWNSTPFPLLFTDPDFVQPATWLPI